MWPWRVRECIGNRYGTSWRGMATGLQNQSAKSLEIQVQSEPQLPFVARSGSAGGARDDQEVATGNVRGWRTEVRGVGEVESLGAELQLQSLLDREGAEEAQVSIHCARSA